MVSNSQQGWSALHWSADRDHIEVVKLLIERGCKINLKGNVSDSPTSEPERTLKFEHVFVRFQRAESALDRAKSDMVRDILSKHSMAPDCYHSSTHNNHNHITVDNSIKVNAK